MDGGTSGAVQGWSQTRFGKGDILLLPNGNAGLAPYRVDRVRWEVDPADMFSGQVSFIAPGDRLRDAIRF